MAVEQTKSLRWEGFVISPVDYLSGGDGLKGGLGMVGEWMSAVVDEIETWFSSKGVSLDIITLISLWWD